MALTGIQILKMLPKTNCGECGIPTCLAFGMKVAAGQIEIGECPYVSDELSVKRQHRPSGQLRLAAVRPPLRLVVKPVCSDMRNDLRILPVLA